MQDALLDLLRPSTALACLLAACGAAGGPDGGGDNLPDRGIIPYQKITAVEQNPPFLFGPDESAGLVMVEPSALVVDGRVSIFFEARDEAGPGGKIVRADSPDGGLTFGRPEVVLEPEGLERVGAPSVVVDPGGVWTMAVEIGQEEGIALATSGDGRAFSLDPEPVLAPQGDSEAGGLGGPSLVLVSRGFDLYYHARPQGEEGLTAIYKASGDAEGFTRSGRVIGPGEGCLSAAGIPEACWDGGGASSPEVHLSRNVATGRTLVRMMYTGTGSGNNVGIGFAASFDGEDWSRFPFNPILAETRRESDPTNIRVGDTFLLYFTDRVAARFGVGFALNQADSPSEVF